MHIFLSMLPVHYKMSVHILQKCLQ